MSQISQTPSPKDSETQPRHFDLGRELVNSPLIILAAPRSFSSVISTMIGQHPQMYGFPELELFGARTVAEWWRLCASATFPRSHGTLRAIAQLYFGEQTERTVKLARGWLLRRCHWTTGFLFEMLALKVYPLKLVEKSTTSVYRMESLQRAYRLFPDARFIHLVRHPRGHGESVMKFIRERQKLNPLPTGHWLLKLASFPGLETECRSVGQDVLDPQRGWYVLNSTICEFLKTVPQAQRLTVQGEDLLTNTEQGMRSIANWLGIRADSDAIVEMMHPERSPFACFGPPGARYGNDLLFLEDPRLRPARARTQSLEEPLSWRADNLGFLAPVKELAKQFGYT